MFGPHEFQSQTMKKLSKKHAGLRVGQFCFNELYACHPTLANEIRATSADPFYNDSNIDMFWAMVFNNWQI